MKIKKFAQLGVSAILSLSSLLTLSIPLASAAGPFTCNWTGGGTTSNFNDAANWSGCNSSSPQAADADFLVFPTGAGGDGAPINNLTNATFSSITFSGTSADPYDISGNAFTTTNGIINTSDTTHAIENNIVVSGNQTINATVAAQGLYLTGNLSGSGTITKAGAGTLELDGDNTSWTGNLTVNGGVVAGSQAHALGSGSGGVTVNNSTNLVLLGCDDYTLTNPLTLSGGSTLTTGDFPTPKLGAAVGCTGAGYGGSDEVFGSYDDSPSSLTLSGALTLGSDITFAGSTGTTTLTGSITGAHSITMLPGYTGKLVVSSSSNGSSTPNGTYTSAQFTKTISDSSAASVEIFGNNIITIDGTRGDTSVWKGGILQGTGTVGSLLISDLGIIAPGHSPGCLNSGDLTLTGIYQVQIGGTTACSGYDQIKVTGAVDVTDGTLTPSLYNGFVPSVGQSYTIITNDGSDAVTGTFKGIAEGGTVTNDGITYSVTYKGGDGNDVVLTVTKVDASKLPAKPNTGLSLVSGHPLLALAVSSVTAAMLIFTSRRLKPARR